MRAPRARSQKKFFLKTFFAGKNSLFFQRGYHLALGDILFFVFLDFFNNLWLREIIGFGAQPHRPVGAACRSRSKIFSIYFSFFNLQHMEQQISLLHPRGVFQVNLVCTVPVVLYIKHILLKIIEFE